MSERIISLFNPKRKEVSMEKEKYEIFLSLLNELLMRGYITTNEACRYEGEGYSVLVLGNDFECVSYKDLILRGALRRLDKDGCYRDALLYALKCMKEAEMDSLPRATNQAT